MSEFDCNSTTCMCTQCERVWGRATVTHLVCLDAGSVEGGLPVEQHHVSVLQVSQYLHAATTLSQSSQDIRQEFPFPPKYQDIQVQGIWLDVNFFVFYFLVNFVVPIGIFPRHEKFGVVFPKESQLQQSRATQFQLQISVQSSKSVKALRNSCALTADSTCHQQQSPWEKPVCLPPVP